MPINAFQRTVYDDGKKRLRNRSADVPFANKVRSTRFREWWETLVTSGLNKASLNRTQIALNAALNMAVTRKLVSIEQITHGEKPRYDGRWRERNDSLPGVAPVVRFKNPLTGDVVVDDVVHGRVVFQNSELDVLQYRDEGFLPEAVLNYLVRLGWSHGDQEFFSIEEMIRLFDITNVNKSASAFDVDKLTWLNQQHMMRAAASRIVPVLRWHLDREGIQATDEAQLEEIVRAQRERAKTVRETALNSLFFSGRLRPTKRRPCASM